ncbi:Beta-ketoadipyl-CoA thiolase [Streptomyces sp. YIM 130001]|uniref:lipid-transfer protein n=1 Tax=Streptomyces sp. YIM 130001 TaxID=2259644 RepID=UPI000E65B422|nr:lipid-transfer protein [Streptomyces sp. YIM 130001]RII17001.1 Beta-ketoadipyl-CoA thiolase [Streptomyces sp. YIM 130001]
MKAYLVGVGMTKFEKPESRDWQYWDMAEEAGGKALDDAGIAYDLVEQAAVGYCFQASTAGQRAVYTLGLTGVPVYNVNNNCATGSTALMMARQFVEGGNDCVLALGFEEMARGALGGGGDGGDFKTSPVARHYGIMAAGHGFEMTPPTAQIFGDAAREHMELYGTTPAQLAAVGAKNHRHSAGNPYAQFQDVYEVDEILAARTVHEPLTKLQCSPTSDGAAAAVVASERFVERHGLGDRAIEIAAQAMTTDTEESFASGTCIDVVGKPMSRAAARQVYERAGLGIEDVDVVELHDCFSINELLTYEALGMCADGESGKLVESGATTYGGRWVVNPSGGLISKGHPLGATGLAQAAELTWQLRGTAGPRQVTGARTGLAHNIGLGGAAVVTLLRKA